MSAAARLPSLMAAQSMHLSSLHQNASSSEHANMLTAILAVITASEKSDIAVSPRGRVSE